MTTAAELIRNAYLLACIIDPTEEVEGFYATTGLRALNNIITQWSSLPTYLQTYYVENINVLTNVYTYTIPTTVIQMLQGHLLDTQNVQSLLRNIDLQRQNTLNYTLSQQGPARPELVYIENQIINVPPATYQDPSTVYFFPVPDQNYTATLYLKKKLGILTQSQVMTEISTAYEMPLLYQLAKSLSIEYSSVLSQDFRDEYERLMSELKAANKQDMSAINSNPFSFHGRRYRPWSSYAG